MNIDTLKSPPLLCKSKSEYNIKRKFLTLIFLSIPLLLFGCVGSDKEPGGADMKENGDNIVAPDGAVRPECLEKIQIGMSYDENHALIQPFCSVNRIRDSLDENVLIDEVVYKENGTLKIARIYYRNRKVTLISYGFSLFEPVL